MGYVTVAERSCLFDAKKSRREWHTQLMFFPDLAAFATKNKSGSYETVTEMPALDSNRSFSKVVFMFQSME